jgi:hypothetical protein
MKKKGIMHKRDHAQKGSCTKGIMHKSWGLSKKIR